MESKKLSDAELIEEAEKWKAKGDVIAAFASAVRTMKELASRLKSANAELQTARDELHKLTNEVMRHDAD